MSGFQRIAGASIALFLVLAPTAGPLMAQNAPPEVLRDISALPEEARRMRQAILAAAASGDIEAIRVPIEMNEIPPVFGEVKGAAAIPLWRERFASSEGREMLAAIIELFRAGFARVNAGRDDEMFVWPYFAATPMASLTPAQQVELLTLVPPAEAKAMMASGKYAHYRIGISAKGVWHFLDKAE